MPTAAQMNVRIDPALKKQGDRVLAKRGLSPSQAVRALYESIAGTKEQSDKVLNAIFGHATAQSDLDLEKAKKLKSIHEIQNSFRNMGHIANNAASDEFSEAEMDKASLEQAIFEHYSKKEISL